MHFLFDSVDHKNILFDELSTGGMVQANQHLIVSDGEMMVLDPGGHKVHTKLFAQMASVAPINQLRHIFFSHQDPDIVAATNAWLMMTDANAYISRLWTRFVMHFGIDDLVTERIHPIPDGGMKIVVGATEMMILPAHFLHSPGNFHVYDPRSKILYSGDLGASLDSGYRTVTDFAAHVPLMEGFHRRYMPDNKATKLWAAMVRDLDIEIIAPQHGAMLEGKEMVNQFLDWVVDVPCGIDLMSDVYRLPS
ncbi:MAG: MBL fold metallo-hydrolase [Actinomycetota bacterium]|nr:MBL fold metallo-hydrolase [Actinomycetota bacterium]